MAELSYILCLLFIIVYSLHTVLCREGRILNGEPATLGLFASQVQIRLKKRNLHKCGGSLVEETHVVTAAVCIDGLAADKLSVMGGDVSLYETTVGSRQFRDVDMIIIHPSYNPKIDRWAYNVAVLKLIAGFARNSELAPVQMATPDKEKYHHCFTPGWGIGSIRNTPPKLSDRLYYAELFVVDFTVCGNCAEKTMCAISTSEKQGVCKGDEGGGLYCNGYLRGIYAGSFNECTGAGATFGDIIQLGPWIKSILVWEGDGEIPLPLPEGRRLAIGRKAGSGGSRSYTESIFILLAYLWLL
ncbi:complement factor D-like isoform X2 [Hermetia illucens]|uniref:complement factor D-like isoform X2 n=1 Tax=Hermetia illucens TaxID=343691 RepID=UPI0018CBF38C|nr:complement factor D-like isoform X2 [Hermetia illucens]